MLDLNGDKLNGAERELGYILIIVSEGYLTSYFLYYCWVNIIISHPNISTQMSKSYTHMDRHSKSQFNLHS